VRVKFSARAAEARHNPANDKQRQTPVKARPLRRICAVGGAEYRGDMRVLNKRMEVRARVSGARVQSALEKGFGRAVGRLLDMTYHAIGHGD
jgi:hypothetical protein